MFSSSAQANEAIVYSHLSPDGYWQIWVMDPDGQNQQQVTTSPQDKRDPTWIKKGQALAFRTNNSQLFTVNLDGTDEKQLLEKFGSITNPNFSADDQWIFFVRFDRRVKDMSDIWQSDLSGVETKILTKDHLGKYHPTLSMDESKIAFVKADPDRTNYHLWAMNVDGSQQEQLTFGEGFDTHPQFSPGGQSLTFSSNRENNFDIYTMPLDTKKIKKLTDNPGLDTNSFYSPDGQRIVFTSDRSGNQQIWVMNADGSSPQQLTNTEGESMDPAWTKMEVIQ